MANPEHVQRLMEGPEAWNAWRSLPGTLPGTRRSMRPADPGRQLPDSLVGRPKPSSLFRSVDLSDADLSHGSLEAARLDGADLRGANLSGASLWSANLREADLANADLSYASLGDSCLDNADLSDAVLESADLTRATLVGCILENANLTYATMVRSDLTRADLTNARLFRADLTEAYLRGTDFTEANLIEADLSRAVLVGTILKGASLISCRVHGISAWDIELEDATQSGLIITPPGVEGTVTAPNIAVAQFIYLLFKNPDIREVIDTIGNQGVLILGRFTERMNVLAVLSEEVRRHGYVPIVFSFERPQDRDFAETVMVLAGLSRFIIADITAPRSVPLESQLIIPNYMIPFVPILDAVEEPFSMFIDLWHKHRDWVLEPLKYESMEELKRVFEVAIIQPANNTREKLRETKGEPLKTRSTKDYM